LYGFSFGHIQDMCTLPLGIEAEFNADAMTLQFLENAVV
jgi:muramoyltetrapeptide carboxypeptidase LdcA involved in peptidoglycan recycling